MLQRSTTRCNTVEHDAADLSNRRAALAAFHAERPSVRYVRELPGGVRLRSVATGQPNSAHLARSAPT